MTYVDVLEEDAGVEGTDQLARLMEIQGDWMHSEPEDVSQFRTCNMSAKLLCCGSHAVLSCAL